MKRSMLISFFSLLILGMFVPADFPWVSQATATTASAPMLSELKNETYKGFEDPMGPITLIDGKWEGEPYDKGGASRPTVTLVGDVAIIGDLDGDEPKEAVVLLNVSTGGTGQFLYLAVVSRRGEDLENVATQFIGDRIQIRDARIQDRQIFLDVVQAGPHDAACCPGELATRGWTMEPNGVLRSINVTAKPEKLTLDAIGNKQWILRSWDRDEPAADKPEITLVYQDGRFNGKSGCNTFFASTKMGEMPGDLSVGPMGSTRKACKSPAMVMETRFLDQLAGARKFGFMAMRLALYYETDGNWGVMLFEGK